MLNKQMWRSPALDIIRSFALLFVVCIHFFLYTGFYTVQINGIGIYFMTLVRTFFMICVPLFMVLSGYLNINKKISKSYYLKILKILGIYVLSSVICVIYSTLVLEKPFYLASMIKGIFAYSSAPYAWYVEMYIVLFLLSPILNCAYKGLENKRQKQILVVTFVLLTSLPSFINGLPLKQDVTYIKIMPDYWVVTYPIMYYFIGCYLREYPPQMKKRYIAVLICAIFVLNGSYNFIRSYGDVFKTGSWQDYFGVGQVLMTGLFFMLFTSFKYEKFPKKLSWLFAKISQLSFGAYLVSWVFDSLFYDLLCRNVVRIEERFPYFVPVVLAVFVCSLLISAIMEGVYSCIAYACKKLFVKNSVTNSNIYEKQ